MFSEVKSTEKHTVKTALDPDVSVLISGGTIASVEKPGVWLSEMRSETTPHVTRRKYKPSCRYRGNGCGPD